MSDACASGSSEQPVQPAPELVVITGMSGAGRSEAIHTFEDLGYFCIDNLPPGFIPKLTELAALPGSRVRRVAVVCDVRGGEFFEELVGELDSLHERGVSHRVVFLEADDSVILNRFKETRRRHPLCETGLGLVEAIEAERAALRPMRARSDIVIDTSGMKLAELRRRIREDVVAESPIDSLAVAVSSFGFKYGSPTDADVVMDVRFLPNPFYDPLLGPMSGLDEPVRQFVLSRDETTSFLDRWLALLDTVMPGYLAEGKSHLAIALGCTGGRHRSVALAEVTAGHLRGRGFRVNLVHRDMGRDPGTT